MIRKYFFATTALFLGLFAFAQAQQKSTLAISKITATKSLENKVASNKTATTFGRIMDSLGNSLTAAMQSGRKFELVTRSDLDAVMSEISLSQSGNVNAADANAAKAGKLKGAKYLLAVSVDDFQDYIENAKFPTLGKTVEKRILRIGAVAKIIDSSTGSILETANFTISNQDIAELSQNISLEVRGDLNDAIINELSRALADKIAQRMTDVIFPAKVVAKTGKIVTINRGDSSGISIGDEYAVFAAGQKMTDPDTGEDLGSEEIMIGKIKIVWITPKTSQGQIVDDNGIDRGQVARLIKKAGADE